MDDYDLQSQNLDASVSNNDLARLMYYLDCVFSLVEYEDQDVMRYRNYRNYPLLNYTEQQMVWFLALTLTPDELDDKVFFHSDQLTGDARNKFYEFSQVRHQIIASPSIFIAGKTRQVKKIMAYKMSWMQTNYQGPMQRLASRLSSLARRPTAGYASASAACVIS